MPDKPLISVIIPTYNRSALLVRSIRSVLAQTYRNIEVIVVDDASGDDTGTVVKEIADDRLSYLRHEINKGGAVARNTGIKAAKGEFIAFQDSDDEWVPEKLVKQLQVFDAADNKTGVVYSGFLIVNDNSETYMPYKDIEKKEGNIYEQLLGENFVGTPTLLIKREVFDTVGLFDERLPRYQDWELAIRMAEKYEFGFVDEPLVRVYAMPVSITADGITRVKARQIILEKHYASLSRYPMILARHLRDLGNFKCLYDSCGSGRAYLARALKVRPAYWSAWLAFFLSFLGKRIYWNVYFSLYKKKL